MNRPSVKQAARELRAAAEEALRNVPLSELRAAVEIFRLAPSVVALSPRC